MPAMTRHLLLLAALLAGPVAGLATETAAEPRRDEVSFTTEARRDIANDQLVADLYVEMTDSDATRLAAAITKTLNEAIATGKREPAVRLTSSARSTWPIYDTKNRLTGWRTRAGLQLESRDFEAGARVLAGLQSSLLLDNVRFELAEATADKARGELVDTAIAAFRARADQVTRALGARAWQLVELAIDTGDGMPAPMYRAARMATMAESMPAPEFAGGDTALQVSARGTIRLQR